MSNTSGSQNCRARCWRGATLAGILAGVLVFVLDEGQVLQAVIVGFVVLVIVGLVLPKLVCGGTSDTVSQPPAPQQPVAKPDPVAAPVAPEAAPDAPQDEGKVKSSTPLAGEAELASRKGEWKYEAEGAHVAAPDEVDETEEAAAAEEAFSPQQPVAETAAPTVKPSTPLAGEAELASRKGTWKYEAASSEAAAGAPETLSAARAGQADDLKKLKGVGPKLEQTLNQLGFYHFDQIAAWTPEQVAWVDERLKFKGRIERDGWIEQAKILAAGGETEFSKRKS